MGNTELGHRASRGRRENQTMNFKDATPHKCSDISGSRSPEHELARLDEGVFERCHLSGPAVTNLGEAGLLMSDDRVGKLVCRSSGPREDNTWIINRHDCICYLQG